MGIKQDISHEFLSSMDPVPELPCTKILGMHILYICPRPMSIPGKLFVIKTERERNVETHAQ